MRSPDRIRISICLIICYDVLHTISAHGEESVTRTEHSQPTPERALWSADGLSARTRPEAAHFFDGRLTSDNTVGWAACHQPEQAFTDGNRIAIGFGGRLGTPNAPTVVNIGVSTSFFWDGRRSSLEAQIGDPFVAPNEHAFATKFLDDALLFGTKEAVAPASTSTTLQIVVPNYATTGKIIIAVSPTARRYADSGGTRLHWPHGGRRIFHKGETSCETVWQSSPPWL